MASTESSAVLGTQQSPIAIDLSAALYSPFAINCLDVTYKDVSSVNGTFKDANFELDKNLRLLLNFRNRTYRLIKLHFHDACEHTIDGKPPSSFELHFVHQLENAKQELLTDKLVLAAFFQIDKDVPPSAGFRMFSDRLKSLRRRKANALTSTDVGELIEGVPLKDFVPDDLSQWLTYQGSLTSYPFTEDVTWVLVRVPESVLKADVDQLIALGAEQDHREVQRLNRRYVLRNFEVASASAESKSNSRRKGR